MRALVLAGRARVNPAAERSALTRLFELPLRSHMGQWVFAAVVRLQRRCADEWPRLDARLCDIAFERVRGAREAFMASYPPHVWAGSSGALLMRADPEPAVREALVAEADSRWQAVLEARSAWPRCSSRG